MLAAVNADLELAESLGVNGVPAFFINGARLEGAMPAEEFRALIEHERKAAEALRQTGVAPDGVYRTIQAALPLMRESGWGRIVNISSDAAIIGYPGLSPYASAKAGLDGLTRTLATELGPANILSNIVMPGFVGTESHMQIQKDYLDMIRQNTPTHRLTTPEDVARLVLFLGSQANQQINGQSVLISGGR